MATIGTFRKAGREYLDEIVTLSVQAKNVRIVRSQHAKRQRPFAPVLRRTDRDRRRLVEVLGRGMRLPQSQA